MIAWVCQDTMIERQEGSGFPNMVEAAHRAGCPAISLSIEAAQASTGTLFNGGPITVSWGTRNFTDALRSSIRPEGVYCSREAQEYALYAPHLREFMLNADYAILPWEEVVRQAQYDIEFFVKPAIHSKRFTGMVLKPENRDRKLSECGHVDPTTPCIVAPVRPEIGSEFRYVIVDGCVVAGSCYRWAGKLDVRRDTLPIADDMADQVAALPWRPEDVFVCDVAVSEDRQRAYVVELNPFASSGLYACDTTAIVTAIQAHLTKAEPATRHA